MILLYVSWTMVMIFHAHERNLGGRILYPLGTQRYNLLTKRRKGKMINDSLIFECAIFTVWCIWWMQVSYCIYVFDKKSHVPCLVNLFALLLKHLRLIKIAVDCHIRIFFGCSTIAFRIGGIKNQCENKMMIWCFCIAC